MSESYDIDPARSLVISRAWGEFSNHDLEEHYRRLLADPAFRPAYAQLADLRDVTRFSVDSALIESMARKRIFLPGTPRAVVAPRGVGYGLARMFASYAPDQEDIRVFEDMADAEAWLAGTHGDGAGLSTG